MAHLGTSSLLGIYHLGRVHSKHAHATSPACHVQSFPLVRAATPRHSWAVTPHAPPWHCLQVSQALLHRSRRPSPTSPTSPTQSSICRRRTSSRCAGARWAHGVARCIPAAHMWLLCVAVPSAETCRPGREHLHTGRVMHTAVVRVRWGWTTAARHALAFCPLGPHGVARGLEGSVLRWEGLVLLCCLPSARNAARMWLGVLWPRVHVEKTVYVCHARQNLAEICMTGDG